MLPETFNDNPKWKSGFTLIELLIVIGITLVMATAAAAPIYGNLQGLAQRHEAMSNVLQTLRIARERAVAGVNDSGHGVFLDMNVGGDDLITLYQGSSFASRDTTLDRVIPLASVLDITSTTGSDINFSQGLGVPNTTGLLSITHEILGSSTISINKFGVVSEE